MTLTPETAIAMFHEAEYRFFDGPIPPEVAAVDVARVPARASSTTGAAGTTAARATTRAADNRTYPYSSGPAAPPLRLHVVHLQANPKSGIGERVCSFTYRYRRALGDSRLRAFRRALACAASHGGHQ